MQIESYIQRTYGKFDKVIPLYAAHMFRTVAAVDGVLGMETDEHLRLPPDAAQMQPMAPGAHWGREYGNLWLRAEITVPTSAQGEILCAIPDAEAVEILCFKDGKPTGIINSKNRFLGGEHSAMFVDACATAGESISLAFECYAGHFCPGCAPYESYEHDTGDPAAYIHTYRGLKLVVMDRDMRDFLFDLSTVLQLARLPGDNFVSMRAHQCLMEAFPHLIQDVRMASEEELRESAAKIRAIIAPALIKNGGERSRGYVGVIGHSHMDTAWLWPVSETVRKCARTYAQALTLMDIYPDYTFVQSSALHLDWMREYYPDIFEGIKQKVAEGRYEPNGGVWVECDCNITGGEAMIRQFLYGQRFTEKYLNYRSDSFWLPDTFGYNAAIPQIMQGCGVKYFYTTKIDWNDLNRFPMHSFVWRGLDGSEVVTHLNRIHHIPDVQNLTSMVRDLADKRSCDMRLAAYGYGDGGGGPTYGMLEFLGRTKDLEGMPKVEPTTVSAFMHRLEERREKLPVYDGELYLELHRGTLTQMHRVKQNNRLAEIALHDMELMSVVARAETKATRDELYKTLLRNQFHDILPGTCISKVYERTIPEMDEMIEQTCCKTVELAKTMTVPTADAWSLYNPLSFDRADVVELYGEHAFEGVTSQTYTAHRGVVRTAVAVNIPAMSSVVLKKGTPCTAASPFRAEDNVLTTPLYRVEFDENGYISSLIDLAEDRELRREGGAPLGTLWLGEDMPRDWDNWDIDDDALSKMRPITTPVSREVVSDGAVEYRIRTEYTFGRSSRAVVDTVFYAGSRRIDYEVTVDWQERHTLLKAGFDVAIRSTTVKSEIQFGHIDRPTTENNSLEASRFEICNHKWSDLSETRYGVALLNDCKYGLSVRGSDMRLTLHKGGVRPDPVTDMGTHTMAYALLPHVGGFDAESVIRPAYEFNYTPVMVQGELDVAPLFALSAPGIICEAVKQAEDVENAYVLRLYEAERNATSCTLTLPDALQVYETNMLEEIGTELPLSNGAVKLKFRPFEIKTILVKR
ncbi:MAG: alpha-mannosidase [Clostridia bacterium]|nr:alpha-mannosidase [Clostridia bacterium]